MKALADRVRNMIGRAVLSAIDDTKLLQTLQVTLLADELADGVERFQNYGFSSHPFPEAEAIVAAVGGTRSHLVAIAVDDRRYRVKGLAEGEVAIYDDQGQTIVLKRGGIEITTDKYVLINAQTADVTADSVTIVSDDINLGGGGGQPVARVGDSVVGGVITSGSPKVKAA